MTLKLNERVEGDMRYCYCICDVFTESRFGGNQLAVLPNAAGLSSGQMQQIAREFNFSETTFVLESETGHTRRVRIFTPTREVPFAGHPNIGTAFALARAGEFGELDGPTVVSFEEKAGVVPITVHKDASGTIYCELTAPRPLSLGSPISVKKIAAALSLPPSDITVEVHPPQEASVGLPFIIVQLRDRTALGRVWIHATALQDLKMVDGRSSILAYTRCNDEFDIRARMFAPLSGVPEDPATGSANCALVGLLSHCDDSLEGTSKWRIAQGIEMGRPSTLHATVEKHDGTIRAIRIGGACAFFSEGYIDIE